jgi:hypothetical protein
MLGEIALGGGLLTVVLLLPFVVTVLLLVLSVTIGSATAGCNIKQNVTKIKLINTRIITLLDKVIYNVIYW